MNRFYYSKEDFKLLGISFSIFIVRDIERDILKISFLGVEDIRRWLYRKFGNSLEVKYYPYDIFFELFNQYLDCKLSSFDKLNYKLLVSDFDRMVLNFLKNIPFGKTVSYKYIGEHLFNGKMSYRAIGGALSRNPLPLIFPCHRVVGKNDIGGYSGGVDIKRVLLKHEKECSGTVWGS